MQAQPSFPLEDPVFTDSIIPRIDIFIDPDSLDAIFNDVESYHEYPATFILRMGNIADTVNNVGFRLRGNTSRYSPKKSFKVSFNTFVRGRKFYGLEKMNINGEHNDPSVIRSKLCWDILRKMGVPASRANHVELYVNGDYYGLYINVEHIDEEFVLSRFGNQDGNLYKCLWPADLVYFSNNPEDYKFSHGDRKAYDLHTNREKDDYSDLFHFIDVLNNTPDNDLACEIEKVFNVDDFLKILAFDVVTGNWDDYSYLKNNYYLYHNTSTGKFEFIPYDLDNTLGIDWIGRDWATREIYDWANRGEERPLHKRILGLQKYRDQYSFYINKLISEVMDTSVFFPRIDSVHSMITGSVERDPYYPLDYGYTIGDFHRSYDEALGGHVTHGLKPFVVARINIIRASLERNNIVPVINYINANHPRLGESPMITAQAFDDDPGIQVEVIYSINDGPAESRIMQDDGMGPDLIAGDQIFTVSLDPVNTQGTILFQVKASSQEGSTTESCQGIGITIFESTYPDLVINEFMARNLTTLSDEFGEFDDWVEIYNRDSNPVWLGDKYLSDDLLEPARWKLPDIILQPGEFILIWTDGQNSQGAIHTNFRLRRSGEEIGIFESPARNSMIIDYLVFGLQADDYSYGRTTDGGDDWIGFSSPTPGISNLYSSVVHPDTDDEPVKAFPNPVTGGMIFFNKLTDVRLHDLSGRLLLIKENTQELSLGHIPAGIYILQYANGEVKKILIQH